LTGSGEEAEAKHTHACMGPKGILTIVNVVTSTMDRPLLKLLIKRPNSLVYHCVFLRRVHRVTDIATVLEELAEDRNWLPVLDCMFSVSCLYFVALLLRRVFVAIK